MAVVVSLVVLAVMALVAGRIAAAAARLGDARASDRQRRAGAECGQRLRDPLPHSLLLS
jgi:hypothetical protein